MTSAAAMSIATATTISPMPSQPDALLRLDRKSSATDLSAPSSGTASHPTT